MLALLAQTLPTTQATAATVADYFPPLSIPILIGIVAATGPLISALMNWRYQAKAAALKTYLEAFKVAKEAGVDVEETYDKYVRRNVMSLIQEAVEREQRGDFNVSVVAALITAILLSGGLYLAAVPVPFLLKVITACLALFVLFAVVKAGLDVVFVRYLEWYKKYKDRAYVRRVVAQNERANQKAAREQAERQKTKATNSATKPQPPT